MRFAGFDWDSANLPKCLGHGVSLAEIEALFAGDVYVVRDAVVDGERRTLAFGNGARRDILRLHLARRPDSAGQRALHACEGGQALCRRNFPI
jgi:uncharacterized DUF497 family protein